jgi:hypothetical protein
MALTRTTGGKLDYEIVEFPRVSSRVLVHCQVRSAGTRIYACDDIPATVAPVGAVSSSATASETAPVTT